MQNLSVYVHDYYEQKIKSYCKICMSKFKKSVLCVNILCRYLQFGKNIIGKSKTSEIWINIL